MALTLRGNGQITSDNYTIDSDGDISARDTSITGNITVNGTISATKGSEATNQDADLGIYHSFRNTSATLSTGVGNAMGLSFITGPSSRRVGLTLKATF